MFKEGCSDCESGFTQKLGDSLGRQSNISDCKEKIVKAYCCLSEMKKKDGALYKESCNFFYYWVVDLISGVSSEDSFLEITAAVMNKLKELFKDGACTILDEHTIDVTTLREMKAVFDYWHDHKEIRILLENSGTQCKSKYDKYLQEIISNYSEMKTYCTSGGTGNDNFCSEFNNKFNTTARSGSGTNIPKPSELTCTSDPTAETLKQKVKPSLQEICPYKLPSKRIYCEFDQVEDACTDDSTKVKGKLEEDNDTKQYSDNIVKAWCHAPKIGINNLSSKDDRCKFFYYWLETPLSTADGLDGKFSSIMEAIYEKLKELNIQDTCDNIYDDISWEIFKQMKKAYNYSKDYATIRACTQGPKAPKSKCTEGDVNYLEKVVAAYGYMNAVCAKENSKDWCKDFRTMAATHSYEELLQIKCKLKYTSDCTNITAAILGTLTSISLPLSAYFLYKYTSLPSLISNTFFGNSSGRSKTRKKRSPRRHHIDSLTDYSTADTSTIDSSETSSTLGSMEESTVRSAPYTSRSSGERGANNNIQQHGQRQRNISYHRI